jgi:hypothetical protein
VNDTAGTRTVVRIFMAWSDEREGRWLEAQARAGWHLEAVRPWGYRFTHGSPAEVAYRLDLLPERRGDRPEYLGLFCDAGWQHLGARGLWQFFRKPVVDGVVPEIHSDPRSRRRTYQRLSGLMLLMLAIQVPVGGWPLAGAASPSTWTPGAIAVALLRLAFLAFCTYGLARLLLLIRRLGSTPAG